MMTGAYVISTLFFDKYGNERFLCSTKNDLHFHIEIIVKVLCCLASLSCHKLVATLRLHASLRRVRGLERSW